jgi:hypothetical protein
MTPLASSRMTPCGVIVAISRTTQAAFDAVRHECLDGNFVNLLAAEIGVPIPLLGA